MKSFFEFLSGIDTMLSVLAAVAGAILFCSRHHVRFETSGYYWRSPKLVGIFVGGSSRGKTLSLAFRAFAIGGKLRTIPSPVEDECRNISEKPFRRSIPFEVEMSGKGNVWCEDLLLKLNDNSDSAIVVLRPCGVTWLSALFSWRIVLIPVRPAC